MASVQSALLLMSASSSARVVLLGVIGVLLVVLGVLIAFAVMLRKRSKAPARWIPHRSPTASSSEPPAVSASASAEVSSDGAGAVAAVPAAAVSSSSTRVCPTCRREYRGGLSFCPQDARPLVAREALARAGTGGTCPSCRRSFDPGVRYCPHDASELVAAAVYRATGAARDGGSPQGVIAKVCPRCASRYDLAATFCGKDGATLETLN